MQRINAILTPVLAILLIFVLLTNKGICQINNTSPLLDNNGKHINAHGGSITYYNGIYYWYGEHKIEDFSKIKSSFIDSIPSQDYIGGLYEGGIHCYSSTNLEQWKNEGIVLSVDYQHEDSPLAYGSIVERPKVLYNEIAKLFVMHFKLKSKKKDELFARHGSPMYYGVAVSKSPVGPFKYHHKYLAGFSDEGAGDYTLYVDDDQTPYLFFAGKPGHIMYYTALTKDFMNPVGGFKRCEGIASHFEAPALFKSNDIYHLLGSGTRSWYPTPPKYAIAKSIHGPWKEIKPANGIIKPGGINPLTNMRADTTFGGQITFILKIPNKKNAFIAMFDQWEPVKQEKSNYFWLPIQFSSDNQPFVKWENEFDPKKIN